ncbi:MAG TPA: hypothetical protein QKA08_02380 [Candidatus Megaira endosymbiont of Nemacystus decipiens]|nr:hypothetical protein [Candidatus Megaera endosymbiont of Nemacystus decipiens]
MKKATILLCLLWGLISSSQGTVIDIKQMAINDAKLASVEAGTEYLKCYALSENEKSLCTAQLNQKYINSDWVSNEIYVREFRFYIEKLGFHRFALKSNLQCDDVKQAPLFVEHKNAYLLKCVPKQTYFLQFDYQDKQWKILS